MVASYLLKVLQHMKYFPDRQAESNSLTEEEVFIGLMLSHFLRVVESNSHTISEVTQEHFQHKSLADIFKNNFHPKSIGTGINVTLAFFNHSCNPNTLKIQKV